MESTVIAMHGNGESHLPLQVGDHIQILWGRTGRIEAIEGNELQISLDTGGTIYKSAFEVALVAAAYDFVRRPPK